jgi:hypothetical protein
VTSLRPSQKNLVRDERAGDLLEMMLVFAVATILVIRGFLALTGYPQLGGGGLHIAHMLWGGLGMLVSNAILLSYWNPAIRQLAASIGGIGFGFFIDELGKFITSDNDYFFQPTIALLYVLFILLFLAVRVIRSKPLTAAEIAINQSILAAMSASGETTRVNRIYTYIDERLRNAYLRLVGTQWFAPALRIAFIVVAIAQIVTILALLVGKSDGSPPDRHIPMVEQSASAIGSAFIVMGVLRLRRSRLSAYRWFMRSTLVSILVTQVFMFYYSELAALGGLLGHVLIYFALRVLILREEELAQPQ